MRKPNKLIIKTPNYTITFNSPLTAIVEFSNGNKYVYAHPYEYVDRPSNYSREQKQEWVRGKILLSLRMHENKYIEYTMKYIDYLTASINYNNSLLRDISLKVTSERRFIKDARN